jgi:UrcA family protein
MKQLSTTLVGVLMLHVISPGALAAAPADDLRREVVRFGDLDLTRAADVQVLYSRIRRAAREVCPQYGPVGYDRSCAQRATESAVTNVVAPLLAAHQQVLARRQPSQTTPARADR